MICTLLSGVLKSPTIIALLSISPFMSVSVCLMYWGAPMLGAQIFITVMTSSWIDPLSLCSVLPYLLQSSLRSILSDMRIATTTFFWFPFAWNIFFHPLTFSLYVSLGLKWVSCRQHIYGSCFCDPRCGLSWRMVHVHWEEGVFFCIWTECAEDISEIHLLYLMYHLRLVFLY